MPSKLSAAVPGAGSITLSGENASVLPGAPPFEPGENASVATELSENVVEAMIVVENSTSSVSEHMASLYSA
ncbi:hypothetical protein FRB95_012560 [Tulasnella sp. JGI-2019a]|nr:hypothetical protein FRB95_012560 [Tulasnella sp. JGI-2019a]